jgi:NAD(P)-dependent dehydrogenase (short-subunit alcohol dehydrogenase family)
VTSDGFELQLGTNHLGNFALTGLLIEAMNGRDNARVVTVSSGAHRMGRINFADLQGERKYRRWGAYSQSKLANLLFAFELDRRLRAARSAIQSLAAHPGYAATNLQFAAAPRLDRVLMALGNRLMAQSAEMGALLTLYAATYPNLEGGTYVGPDSFFEQRGYPQVVSASPAARDEESARRLWKVSEELLRGSRPRKPGGSKMNEVVPPPGSVRVAAALQSPEPSPLPQGQIEWLRIVGSSLGITPTFVGVASSVSSYRVNSPIVSCCRNHTSGKLNAVKRLG